MGCNISIKSQKHASLFKKIQTKSVLIFKTVLVHNVKQCNHSLHPIHKGTTVEAAFFL